MHESSMMVGLLRQVEAVAREKGADRILAVDLRIGALAGMTAEHLREHWDLAVAGGVAEGADLRVTVSDDPFEHGAYGVTLTSVDIDV